MEHAQGKGTPKPAEAAAAQRRPVSDRRLFSTEHGDVFECACFGRLVMTFKGYWMAFDRSGFLRFRHEVAGLLHCPRGRDSIAREGLRFNGSGGDAVLVLNTAETEEMVWLMDASQAILAGQEAGRR